MLVGFEIDDLISTPVRTLTDSCDVRAQKVIVDARETLEAVRAAGHQILLYTRRDVSVGIETETWLQRNKIPYDKIIFNRPHNMVVYFSADVRQFVDWKRTRTELQKYGVVKGKEGEVLDTGTPADGKTAGDKRAGHKTKKKVGKKPGDTSGPETEKRPGIQVLK